MLHEGVTRSYSHGAFLLVLRFPILQESYTLTDSIQKEKKEEEVEKQD